VIIKIQFTSTPPEGWILSLAYIPSFYLNARVFGWAEERAKLKFRKKAFGLF